MKAFIYTETCSVKLIWMSRGWAGCIVAVCVDTCVCGENDAHPPDRPRRRNARDKIRRGRYGYLIIFRMTREVSQMKATCKHSDWDIWKPHGAGI